MTTLDIHDDRWLALPAEIRQQLGVKTGDEIKIELVGERIVLRRIARSSGTAKAKQADQIARPRADHAAPKIVPSIKPSVDQRTGDLFSPDEIFALQPATQVRRPRGRPRKAAAPEPKREAEPLVRMVVPEQARLVRKAELMARKPATEPVSEPAKRSWQRPTTWVRAEPGHERDERRPFRNVEVRKLGPDRKGRQQVPSGQQRRVG